MTLTDRQLAHKVATLPDERVRVVHDGYEFEHTGTHVIVRGQGDTPLAGWQFAVPLPVWRRVVRDPRFQ